jgi:hypothetical protein
MIWGCYTKVVAYKRPYSLKCEFCVGRSQSAIQWYRGLFPQKESRLGVYLTTHVNLLRKLRIYGAVPSSTPSYIFTEYYKIKHRNQQAAQLLDSKKYWIHKLYRRYGH